MKIVAQLLVAAVCVAFGFALGRMFPADKGPSPRPSNPGTSVAGTTRPSGPGVLPTPKGTNPSTTPISASPTTGPVPADHEHEKG